LRKLWMKLMVSYAVATILALVAGNLVNGMIEDYRLRKWLKPKYQSERAINVSKEIAPWLKPSSRDVTALTLWLEKPDQADQSAHADHHSDACVLLISRFPASTSETRLRPPNNGARSICFRPRSSISVFNTARGGASSMG